MAKQAIVAPNLTISCQQPFVPGTGKLKEQERHNQESYCTQQNFKSIDKNTRKISNKVIYLIFKAVTKSLEKILILGGCFDSSLHQNIDSRVWKLDLEFNEL